MGGFAHGESWTDTVTVRDAYLDRIAKELFSFEHWEECSPKQLEVVLRAWHHGSR